PQQHWSFADAHRIRDALKNHIAEGADDDSFPIVPQRLVKDVREVMPDDGIIALDNGMYKIWFARNYPAYQPNTVLLDNALATMAPACPRPWRPSWCIRNVASSPSVVMAAS